MPTVELSSRTYRGLACPAGGNEITYWSKALPGFGLRIRKMGARSWVAMARLKGSTKVVKRTLGDAETVRIGEAQDAARTWLASIKRGEDPGEAARQRRQAIGFRKFVELYCEHQQPRLKQRSYTELRRHLITHARSLHRKPAIDVTRQDIVEVLQRLATRVPTTANHVRASLSALYAWGMKAGLVPANPVVATFRPGEVRSRDRVLTDAELAWIWQASMNTGDHGAIVRLLIATGARRSEVAGMCESELIRHSDGSITWTIPGDRAKNGLPNELILPPWIASLIPACSKNERDLLFGAGARGFNNWAWQKGQLNEALKQAGQEMPCWVLHDLRRTFVTRLNDLGVDPHVVESLVNHVSGASKASVAGVYNRSPYRRQKHEALERWCAHIRSLVEPNAGAGRDDGRNIIAFSSQPVLRTGTKGTG
jgi:integrase